MKFSSIFTIDNKRIVLNRFLNVFLTGKKDVHIDYVKKLNLSNDQIQSIDIDSLRSMHNHWCSIIKYNDTTSKMLFDKAVMFQNSVNNVFNNHPSYVYKSNYNNKNVFLAFEGTSVKPESVTRVDNIFKSALSNNEITSLNKLDNVSKDQIKYTFYRIREIGYFEESDLEKLDMVTLPLTLNKSALISNVKLLETYNLTNVVHHLSDKSKNIKIDSLNPIIGSLENTNNVHTKSPKSYIDTESSRIKSIISLSKFYISVLKKHGVNIEHLYLESLKETNHDNESAFVLEDKAATKYDIHYPVSAPLDRMNDAIHDVNDEELKETNYDNEAAAPAGYEVSYKKNSYKDNYEKSSTDERNVNYINKDVDNDFLNPHYSNDDDSNKVDDLD